MSKIRGPTTKFEIKKFNGKGNFDSWQKRVKALLLQQGLHKALQGKLSKHAGTLDEDWEEMDLKATNTIQLYLADKMMSNMMDEEKAITLWSRLETYMKKSFSNKLYLKK